MKVIRDHTVAFALTLAIVGLFLFGAYQRNQIVRIDRNATTIGQLVEQLRKARLGDRAAARLEEQRTFDACVRQAVLRRHVNLTTRTLREMLKRAARQPGLTAAQRTQIDELLAAYTIAPGPETRKECVRISPPPPKRPTRARRSEVAP